jgi:hypothetical protein
MLACKKKLRKWKEAPGRRPFRAPRPGEFFKSLQQDRRPAEGKPRLFEGIDDLFDTGYLVIEGDDCDVGEFIDF